MRSGGKQNSSRTNWQRNCAKRGKKSLGQRGEALSGKDYAAVGMGLKYFDRKLRTNKSLRQIHQPFLQFLNLEM